MKKINIKWKENIGCWYNKKEIKDFLNTKYINNVLSFVINQNKKFIIYPKNSDIFRAFKLCNPDDLKVVILGQDPYFDGKATGLAFANNENVIRLSPSLKKIEECIEKTVYKGFKLDFDCTLESWARQGVLLLNTSLSVQKGIPNSHKVVWNNFTKFIIKYISNNYPGTIFLLWGNEAKSFKVIDNYDISKTCNVLEYHHPSYSARNDKSWDCNHFNEVNKLINKKNGSEFKIIW